MWRQKKVGWLNLKYLMFCITWPGVRIIGVLSGGRKQLTPEQKLCWQSSSDLTLTTAFRELYEWEFVQIVPPTHFLNKGDLCVAKKCLRGCKLSAAETWVISQNRTLVIRGQPPPRRGAGQWGAWPGRLSRRAPTRPCETPAPCSDGDCIQCNHVVCEVLRPS